MSLFCLFIYRQGFWFVHHSNGSKFDSYLSCGFWKQSLYPGQKIRSLIFFWAVYVYFFLAFNELKVLHQIFNNHCFLNVYRVEETRTGIILSIVAWKTMEKRMEFFLWTAMRWVSAERLILQFWIPYWILLRVSQNVRHIQGPRFISRIFFLSISTIFIAKWPNVSFLIMTNGI